MYYKARKKNLNELRTQVSALYFINPVFLPKFQYVWLECGLTTREMSLHEHNVQLLDRRIFNGGRVPVHCVYGLVSGSSRLSRYTPLRRRPSAKRGQ